MYHIMLQTQHVRNSIVELFTITAPWCRKGTSLTRESQLYFCPKNCLHAQEFPAYHTYRNAIGTATYICDVTDFYAARCAEHSHEFQQLPLTLSAIAIL